MRKRIIGIGLALLMCVGLFGIAGCAGYEYKEGDFTLDIEVEKTTMPFGEDFTVEVYLNNHTDQDIEIVVGFMDSMYPRVDGERFFNVVASANPDVFYTIKSGAPKHNTRKVGADGYEGNEYGPVPIGTHELQFRIGFCVNWKKRSQKTIDLWSNVIMITVV